MAKNNKANAASSPGPVYFFGFVGAAVYYIHVTSGFGSALVGILKAIVWPAYLVYHLLGL